MISEQFRLITIQRAHKYGLEVQLDLDGKDVYSKLLMFKSDSLPNYIYMHKDVGFDQKGFPKYLLVAVHPDDFDMKLVDSSAGITERINRKTGENLFSHSGYRGFPYASETNEPTAKCYKLDSLTALEVLLDAIDTKHGEAQRVLRAISLKNFKGVEEKVRIEFRPITLLFGPNSAGKSTILQSLVYAREVLERHNLDPDKTVLGGSWLDLGGFRNLVNQHDLEKDIEITFELNLAKTDLTADLSGFEERELERSWGRKDLIDFWLSKIEKIDVSMSLIWSEILQRPIVQRVQYHVNDELLGRIVCSQDGREVLVDYLSLHADIFRDSEFEAVACENTFEDIVLANIQDEYFSVTSPDLRALPLQGCLDAIPQHHTKMSLDPSVWKENSENSIASTVAINGLINGVFRSSLGVIRESLDDLVYLGPLREVPERDAVSAKSPDVSRWSQGTAAWDILRSCSEEFLEQVNRWLFSEERLNTGYFIDRYSYRELPTTHSVTRAILSGSHLDEDNLSQLLRAIPELSRISLRDECNDISVFPQDIGVGISQLLPIVVAALHFDRGILAVEQPELHVHPGLQVALGDLFADAIAEKDSIFLLETHSEHLMLRLLRRIRETTDGELPPSAPSLSPEQIAVYFVENDRGGMKISLIDIDEDGEFTTRWPRGFFAERRKELM